MLQPFEFDSQFFFPPLLGCPRKLGSKVIGSVGDFTPRNTPFVGETAHWSDHHWSYLTSFYLDILLWARGGGWHCGCYLHGWQRGRIKKTCCVNFNPWFTAVRMVSGSNQPTRKKHLPDWKTPFSGARWALSSYKWSYNPYKWPYKWLTVLISLVIGVINPVITGRGPTLWWV